MGDRILVIEDEANIAETIKIAIENESYGCDWAATGEVALEHLAHEAVSLVVLDVGLPDMSGFELLKRIRQTHTCLLYTSPSPRDATLSRMPSSA